MGLLRRLLAALLPLLLLAGSPEGARAHAVLQGTEPADGAVLAEAPREIEVRFSEPVSAIRAQVLDRAGQDVLAPGAVAGEGDVLRLELPAALGEGTYTVSYRVVSLDGHPVGGSLVFSVGSASGGSSAPSDATEAGAWRWAPIASWAVLYLALLGAAGGVLFAMLVRPGDVSIGPTRRIVAVSAVTGVLAAVVALGAQGGLLLDGSTGSLLQLGTWEAGARSTFGRAALCAVAGLALVLLGVVRPPSAAATLLGLAGAALALGSFVLTGHVVTAGPWWLTWPLLLAHTGLVAFWIGSLIPLHRALREPAGHAGPLVERFSRLAVILVPVLLVTGGLIAVLQVGRVEALVATAYGRVLLLKIALVSGLMGLAALNRLRLTPALRRGEAGASDRLGRSILAELGLVAAILAATAALGTTPPPRALDPGRGLGARDAHAHEEHGHIHGALPLRLEADAFRAEVMLRPGRAGDNAAAITLSGKAGEPLEVMEVAVRLSNPARGIEPLERQAERQGPGLWRAEALTLGVPGEWEVALEVLVSDFESATARATLVLE